MMMKYSEQQHGNTSVVDVDDHDDDDGQQLQLTPVWEYVIRAKTLPDNLDLDVFFQTIHERLHSPEWEVRQHALRVFVDFIPLIPVDLLDAKIEIVLNDLVTNLGHPGPAVRKGAVDGLRAYVSHTAKPNAIIRNLVETGIAQCQENKIQTNVVLGIVLSLPYLINDKLDATTNTFIVHKLLDKIVKVVHQETVLRALVRIREIVGYDVFDYALSTHDTYNSKKDFDLLCEIYDLQVFNHNNNNNSNNAKVDKDKVILETEIQLDSGPAITMKIHEEGENNRSNNQTFQVLPDDDDSVNNNNDGADAYEHLRRTPRRVRFGGEVVKLRTPDSDSNIEEEATISITSDVGGKGPVIEIKYVGDNDKKKAVRSLIPRPIKQTQSAPNSPERGNLRQSRLFKSSPNLSRRPRVKLHSGKSRIPIRLRSTSGDRSRSSVKIKLRRNSVVVGDNQIKVPPLVVHQRRNSREDAFSPIPVHNEIEVLHNLTRSPSPSLLAQQRHKTNDVVETSKSPDAKPIVEPTDNDRKVLSEVTNHLELDKRNNNTNNNNNGNEHFPSFHVYNSINDSFYDLPDSPIPTKDTGDCLTCSSSGSESDKRFGGVDERIISDIQNMDDVRIRQRGLEELLRVIQTTAVVDALQDRLPSLLHILFVAEQQPILQSTAEQTLGVLFTSMDVQCLITRLHQIALNLSKMGTPSGVRLAILLMRRINPRLVVDQLLAEPILNAKSSKVREGALQILMTVSRIFPSTDLNIPKSIKCVIGVLHDRKRRVRQAALETLAALAQLSSNTAILETANELTQEWNDREQILKVIRTRLSRKQLPLVNMNGNIRYSTPTGDSEIEWLSNGSNSASPQSRDENHHHHHSKHQLLQVEGERFVKLLAPPSSDDVSKQRKFSGTQQETIALPSRAGNASSSSSNRFISSPNPTVNYTRFVQDGGGGGDDARMMMMQQPPPLPQQHVISSATKVNYWRNNPRRGGLGFDVLREDPLARSPSTQIWAIDPTNFQALASPSPINAEKVPSVNGALRQIYVIKANDAKSASTNTSKSDLREDATNTSPMFGKSSSRGRSFSPPLGRNNKASDYDSYEDDTNNERFISINRTQRRSFRNSSNSNVRKSYSSEYLSHHQKQQRASRENLMSSGSSSGSSVRQSGSWQRDFRSNIPIPVSSDNKIRIRKSAYNKPKGPMTIPYYNNVVKSPSPHQTPPPTSDKFPTNIMPFSSGSESSGYFTPPPEPDTPPHEHHESNEPSPHHRTPPPSSTTITTTTHHQPSPSPERFIQIVGSPIKQPQTFDDSDIEDEPDDDVEEEKVEIDGADVEEKVVRRMSTTTSLDDFKLNDMDVFTERTLAKNETTLSLDFDKLKFDADPNLHRKNISSAPALNKSFDELPIKATIAAASATLPGSCIELIDDVHDKKSSTSSPSPKKNLLLRRKSSRYSTSSLTKSERLLSAQQRPFTKPRDAMYETITQLESNEWEITMKGLQNLVRLIVHHKDHIEHQMHTVCVLLGKQIRNLRSQVARQACLAATELFGISRRPLEMELDEVAAPLLHRTADTNRFLRSDANAALDEMSLNLSVPKVVSVIVYRGCGHQNAIVRCAAARLLCNIATRLGSEKVFQLPRDTRDKILNAGANMLTEGSLETRKYAKMLFGQLAEHCQFQRALAEAVPPQTLRHIDKTLKSLIK